MSSAIKFLMITTLLSADLAFSQTPPAARTQTPHSLKPAVNQGSKSTKSAPNTPGSYTLETCQKLHQKYAIAFQELWKKRGIDLKSENTDGYALIEDLELNYCNEETNRKVLIELLTKMLNMHSGKIGVILPLANHNYLRHFMTGFEAYIRAKNLDPKTSLVVIDNQSQDNKTHKAVASLIFEHKVSAIIGGSEPGDAAILKYWAQKLLIPTFILSEPKDTIVIPHVFYSMPTQKSLARAAVTANLRFGHKRVSILSPVDQHSDVFIQSYEAQAKAAGITVVHRIPYDGKRFDSMEAAAKKIFSLDGVERSEELKLLYEEAKKHAQQTGTKFNPKMVALQPDIQQDAVLIPDNFKIVRHFAKIFSYLGVRKMPLFGHFEWRSTGILSPWDSFLQGAYFVDFQGAYTSMPDQIKIPTTDSFYFVSPDKVDQADLSLIAWKTIEWPIKYSQMKSEMRRKLELNIARKQSTSSDVAFDQENTIVWTPSLFQLNGNGSNKGSLSLLNQ